jgi:hypothetical protein
MYVSELEDSSNELRRQNQAVMAGSVHHAPEQPGAGG